MKILCIWKEATGVEYHRLIKPLTNLHIEHGIEVDFVEDPVRTKSMPDPTQYDLILFNRWTCEIHLHLLKSFAELKVPYIVDIDDYWKLPKHHPASKHYKALGMTKLIEETIRYADGVTCTSEELARHIRPLNTKLAIIPNAIDTTDYQWREKKGTWEGKRIGYFAGITHHNDAQIVGEALSILFQEYGIRTVYGGYSKSTLCQSMAKRLNGSNKKMEVQVIPSMAPDKYGEMYTNVDLVIAPLENTTYNNCKSDLKILEAQAYGLPIVCSNVLPYSEHQFSHGVYLTENTTEAWVQTILKALEHQDGERYTRSLDEVNDKRLEFYKRVIGESVRV